MLLEEHLRGGEPAPAGEEFSEEELRDTLGEINESLGRARSQELADDAAYLPRDVTIGGFQMGVERHAAGIERANAQTSLAVSERDQVEAYMDLGEAPELPPVTEQRLPLPPDLGEMRLDWEPGSFNSWPDDFLWGGIAGALVHRALHGSHKLNPEPARVTLEGDARFFLFSDWATGLPRPVLLSSKIRARLERDRTRPKHVIHLGDVYYAGWPWEAQDRALDPWPVPFNSPDLATSWDLNGNHDMYSGGEGYFKTLLADHRFQQQRSADGEPTSIFELSNDHWLVLGIDSAWNSKRLHTGTEGDLQPEHVHWIEQAVQGAGERKVLFLSHHQLFSAFDNPTMLADKLGAFLDEHPIHAWFWGHEHRCAIYKPSASAQVANARCIGNGGVPAYVTDASAIHTQGIVAHDFEQPYAVPYKGRQLVQYGFAILEFDGPDVNVSYIDEDDNRWHRESL